MCVYSMSLSLLLCALINPGIDSHVNYIKCNEKHRFAFQENPQDCVKGDGVYIQDIFYTMNRSLEQNDTLGNDSFSEKTFEAHIRRDCSRKLTCNMTSSLRYLEKYKCDDVSLPISNIALDLQCKLTGESYSEGGFYMCRTFKRKVHKNPSVLVLESGNIVKTGCTLKSNDDKITISLRTLQVEFGSECDTSRDCNSSMEITLDKNISKTLKSFDKNSTTFIGSSIKLDIVMQTGLVWLEVYASSGYTINCKNVSDCTGVSSDDNDSDNDNDDRDNVTIIVLSLIAAVATVILISVCAVSVCRVHVRVGVIQRWLPSKPQATSEHTDEGSVDIFSQGSTTATTPSGRTKTSVTTLSTERGQGDYWEISSLSRSSTHSNEVQVVLLPGTRRRSYSSQGEDDKNPYSELEGNEMNIPGCGGTLRKNDKNPYSELEGNEMNIPVSDGTLGEAQAPEIANPSPTNKQGSASPTPSTNGHSPTFKLKGSELEDGAECGKTAAPLESDYSLASNCDEQPSNSPNKLYNTLDSLGGAYSHLRPIGEQKKIISNIYNG